MREHVELQHLVENDIECQTNPENTLKMPKHKSYPYLGLILATLSSLFFSLCSVIVKGLVEVSKLLNIVIKNINRITSNLKVNLFAIYCKK